MPRKKKEGAHVAVEKHDAKNAKIHETEGRTQESCAPASKTVAGTNRLFGEVKPENYFVLCDGRVIKEYKELAKLLETVSDDIFYYHVTSERNDFANWVNDIFKEEELANGLRSSKSKIEMIALLYKRLFERAEKLL